VGLSNPIALLRFQPLPVLHSPVHTHSPTLQPHPALWPHPRATAMPMDHNSTPTAHPSPSQDSTVLPITPSPSLRLPVPPTLHSALPPGYLYDLGNLNPLSDGHVTGVQEGLALQHCVDDPLVRTGRAAEGRAWIPFLPISDSKPPTHSTRPWPSWCPST
jgi:hypothetical protein